MSEEDLLTVNQSDGTDQKDASFVQGEISAEQRHVLAQAMIKECQAKGMSVDAISHYALGLLDANSPDYDKTVLMQVLEDVNPDTMSQAVVDSEFKKIVEQENASELSQSKQPDSTTSEVEENFSAQLDSASELRINRIVDDLEGEIRDINNRLDSEEIQDSEKHAMAERKIQLENQLAFMNRRAAVAEVPVASEYINEPQELIDEISADKTEEDQLNDIYSETSEKQSDPSYGYARTNREDDKHKLAQLYADQKMEADLEEGSFIEKGAKRFFKGRLLRRFYETRYKQEYDRLCKENGNYLEVPLEILRGVDPEIAKEMSRRASMATTEWLLSQDDYIVDTRRSGEQRSDISGDPETDARLRIVLKDLALRYASGELDDDTIIQERDRLFGEIEGLNQDLFGKGVGFSDSIIELARSVKADIDQGVALDRVESALGAIELRGGYSRGSAEAEVRRTVLDKISKKIGTSRIGGTAIASALITATSLVFCATERGATSGAATVLRMTGIGAGAAGAIAGATEYGVVKREATLVRQEHAYGYEKDDQANPRRRAMEQAIIYHSESVPEAVDNLQCYLDENGQLLSDLSDNEILEVAKTISQLKTLIRESDSRKIDLLKFSSVAAAPAERLELVMSLAAVEVALDDRMAQGGNLTIIGPNNLPQEIEISTAVETVIATSERSTESDVDTDQATHDKAYKLMMAKRVAVAAAAGTVSGFVAGVVVSETAAAINPNINGVFEQQQTGKVNTLLTTLFQGQENGPSTSGANQEFASILAESKGTHLIEHKGTDLHLRVPDGVEARFSQGSNTFDLVSSKNGDTLATNIEFNNNGRISQSSIDELRLIGLDLDQKSVIVDGRPKQVKAEKFIDWHERRGELEKTRIVDNATNAIPGLVGDHNELDVHAAGHDGNWRQQNGSIRVGISGITEDGSWSGNRTYDVPKALEQGRGKIMITVDNHYIRDGGYHTFLFDVVKDKNGDGWHAVIPKNHPVNDWFGNGGSIDDFHGPSLEQLQNPGSSSLDSRNSFAFVITENNNPKNNKFVSIASIPGTGTGEYRVPNPNVEYKSRLFGQIIQSEGQTLPAFGPPIYERRGVGAPNKQEDSPPTYYGERYSYGDYGYGSRRYSEEEVQEILSEVSPEMASGQTVKLAEQSAWYEARLREDFGDAYLDEINNIINSDPRLQSLPSNTQAVVTIPVGSLYEAQNIYGTLSVYNEQIKVEPGSFSIVLGLNQVEGTLDNPENRSKREQTLKEIKRAQQDFPELNIIVLDYEVPRKEVEEAGAAIGSVTRRLYDAVALATGRLAAQDKLDSDDILMIRNDADVQGLSPVYIERLLKAQQRLPDSLAYTGESLLDFTRLMKSHPGLALTVGFDSMLARLNPGRTAGANFAVKAGAYCGIRGTGRRRTGGAGSDDLAIGTRIQIARGKKTRLEQYGQYSVSEMDDDGDRTISFVGASLESSGERQLRAYNNDRNPINSSWSDFSEGSDGYQPRNSNTNPGDKEKLGDSIDKAEKFITELINDRQLPRAIAEYHLTRYLGSVANFRISKKDDGTLEFKFTNEGRKFVKKLQKGAQLSPGKAGIAGRNIRAVLNQRTKIPRYIRSGKNSILRRRFI